LVLLKISRKNYLISLAISQNSQTLANVNWDKNINFWNMITHKKISDIQLNSESFIALGISPNGQVLASGTNNKITLWNITTGEDIRTLTGYSDGIIALAFSPNGKFLATGTNDQKIQIWNLITGKIIHTFAGHSSPITSVAFSPDGQKLVSSSSEDNSIKVWRLPKVVR